MTTDYALYVKNETGPVNQYSQMVALINATFPDDRQKRLRLIHKLRDVVWELTRD